jgi:hypothetical protein
MANVLSREEIDVLFETVEEKDDQEYKYGYVRELDLSDENTIETVENLIKNNSKVSGKIDQDIIIFGLKNTYNEVPYPPFGIFGYFQNDEIKAIINVALKKINKKIIKNEIHIPLILISDSVFDYAVVLDQMLDHMLNQISRFNNYKYIYINLDLCEAKYLNGFRKKGFVVYKYNHDTNRIYLRRELDVLNSIQLDTLIRRGFLDEKRRLNGKN